MPPAVTLTTLTALADTQDGACPVAGVTPLDAAVVSYVADLLADLVASGAALGWVEPPSRGGIEQLTLDARGDNSAAHALWRSRGFVEYGRIADFVAVGENRYDKTFWVLDLRDGKRTS